MKMENFKKHQILLIPTDKQSVLFIKGGNKLEYSVHPPLHGIRDLGWKYQHLYVISDDSNFTTDDYIYNSKYHEVCKATERDINSVKFWREEDYVVGKVIATTDETLKLPIPEGLDMYPMSYTPKSLPNIKPNFLDFYVEQYNENNIINLVLVEYADVQMEDFESDKYPRYEKFVKVNIDNMVNIMVDTELDTEIEKNTPVSVIDQKIKKLMDISDNFVFIEYYSHTKCDMYKVNNQYTNYNKETFTLCPVTDGIERALDLAIQVITDAKEKFFKN